MKTFQVRFIEEKNISRKDFYLSYKNLMNQNNDFIIDDEYNIYGGYLSIPKGSTFYLDICIDNNVDFTEKKDVLSFFNSELGKKITTKLFTRRFILQPRKYLSKHKVFDGRLLSVLIAIKIGSDSMYRKIIDKMGSSPSLTSAKLIVPSFYV